MDISSLKVNTKDLQKLTIGDRIKTVQNEPSFLASLTPSQLAAMFPGQYRQEAENLQKSLTGASLDTGSGNFSSSSGSEYYPEISEPQKSPGVKETFREHFNKAMEKPTPQTGNPLAKERERFKKELDENPQLKRKLAGLLFAENVGAGPAVIESLLNRLLLEGRVKGKIPTIDEYLNRKGKNQFYGPIRRRENLSITDLQYEKATTLIDEALAGSNVTEGATDQGSGNDPNVRHKGGKKVINGETFNDFGGFGHDVARKFREEQQQSFRKWKETPVGTASVVPEQNPEITGSTSPVSLIGSEWDVSKLTPEAKELYETLPEEERKRAESEGTNRVNEIAKEYREKNPIASASEIKEENPKKTGSVEPQSLFAVDESRVKQSQQEKAAIRKLPLSPKLNNVLEYAAAQSGVEVEVWSGGQAKIGTPGPRTGSKRHDEGNAADLDVYVKDEKSGKRRKLLFSNPDDKVILESFIQHAASAGATGIGGGTEYMGDGRLHVGFGSVATWGSGKKWIARAAKKGRETPVDPVEWAKNRNESDSQKQLVSQPNRDDIQNRGLVFGHPGKSQEQPSQAVVQPIQPIPQKTVSNESNNNVDASAQPSVIENAPIVKEPVQPSMVESPTEKNLAGPTWTNPNPEPVIPTNKASPVPSMTLPAIGIEQDNSPEQAPQQQSQTPTSPEKQSSLQAPQNAGFARAGSGLPDRTQQYANIVRDSGNTFKTASMQRATMRTRFSEAGDPLDSHFSNGAANLKA